MVININEALVSKSQAPVLPQTLHGLGGVGKTQLAVEYVYRYVDHVDLVWWKPRFVPDHDSVPARSSAPDHEYTLVTANHVASGLQILGDYRAVVTVDRESLRRHREVFGDEDLYTLQVRSNVAVNLRMLGELGGEFEIDTDLIRRWHRIFGPGQYRTVLCQANVARGLPAMGWHNEAHDLLGRVVPDLRDEFGPSNVGVLVAARSQTITRLRPGNFEDAVAHAREPHAGTRGRFGANHEYTLAAAMTLANAPRTVGETGEARVLAKDAVGRYRRDFGQAHSYLLSAEINLGMLLRTVDELDRYRELDEHAESGFLAVLGLEHTCRPATAEQPGERPRHDRRVRGRPRAVRAGVARIIRTRSPARARWRSTGWDRPYGIRPIPAGAHAGGHGQGARTGASRHCRPGARPPGECDLESSST